MTYQDTDATPSTAGRTVTFKAYDGRAYSKAVTRSIQWTTGAAAASPSTMPMVQDATPAANDAVLLAILRSLESLDGPQWKTKREGLLLLSGR